MAHFNKDKDESIKTTKQWGILPTKNYTLGISKKNQTNKRRDRVGRSREKFTRIETRKNRIWFEQKQSKQF